MSAVHNAVFPLAMGPVETPRPIYPAVVHSESRDELLSIETRTFAWLL